MLLLDGPVALEVEGLRRALGHTSRAQVAPHLTLVPPVNVRHEDLGAALAVLRRAAAYVPGPLDLVLGPPATFWPQSPVVYLPATGPVPVTTALARVHDEVLDGPLLRPERWPWTPHVTLADEATPERIDATLAALADFTVEIRADRLVLMEEVDRSWSPLADVCFGPPVVVGRGGLQLEVVTGRALGPDVSALFDSSEAGAGAKERTGADLVVLTGLRGSEVAGAALAWWGGTPGAPVHVAVAVGPGCRGQGVGRALLAQLELEVERRGAFMAPPVTHGPAEFYRRSSHWASSGLNFA